MADARGPATPPAIVWRTATVAATRAENDHARTLELDVPGWPGHRAGQYLDVRLTAEDGYQAQRSFSLASAPESGRVEITVERIDDGEVSPYLVDELRVGDQFELRGPIGGPFTWSVADGGPLLLIAGGSGLVPLMAMLRHRAARGSTIDARALVSVRGPGDLLYRDELTALASDDRLDLRPTYTRLPPPGWSGFAGRIDAAMVAAIGPPPQERPLVFVCGPTPFVEHAADLLVDGGHDPARIRTERFGPS
ncbi:Flavodoxin reductases (ferredoxin-NADPH reductases) family 1 [Patulibacter medicamentivorans]|uniref:Flavodoxin reductases (Ferredoxin-NADPH reductases) family 1 n=1 Tax=Patulibacter medicamentivorans TaxID=1097667 RepID=H0EAG1_9ACTN|nr:ferredoxin reductase [Patulibacter medicamentivorans]EHN09288.1 Flavodoxin reductases (ferredoxin-NADPH reductases) family 1 [Patulibacter medicamentivorans]